MTDDQMFHLAGQLAQISRQATPSPMAAAFTLMIAAIQNNRTAGLPDELTKEWFEALINGDVQIGPGNDAPVRLVN